MTNRSAFLLGFGACLALVLIVWGSTWFGGDGPPVDDRPLQEAQEIARVKSAEADSLRAVADSVRARTDTVIVRVREQAARSMRRAMAAGTEVSAGLDSLEASVRPEVVPLVRDVRRLVEAEREEHRAVIAAQAVHIEAVETQLAGADRVVASLTELREADGRVIEAWAVRSGQLETRVRHFERRAKAWEWAAKFGGTVMAIGLIGLAFL